MRPADWSRSAPRPRSRLAPARELAPVGCVSNRAFPLDVPSASVALPRPEELPSRFVQARESGQRDGLKLKSSLDLQPSSSAEPPWRHRPPNEHEKTPPSQPPGSVQPPP